MSLIVRKPAFCICENKDTDQLRGNLVGNPEDWFSHEAHIATDNFTSKTKRVAHSGYDMSSVLRKPVFGAIRFDTNLAVQPQKMA